MINGGLTQVGMFIIHELESNEPTLKITDHLVQRGRLKAIAVYSVSAVMT